MVGIQNTTQHKFFLKSLIFVCVSLLLFLVSASFVYAGPKDWIHSIGIGVGGWVAGFGGLLFDNAVNSLVLQMGDWFVNRGLGSVIADIWTMIRDLFNILFIFSLVYIGLRTILDSDDSRTKKMLGMLIAAALLINFSLYIAKVVVDVSNFTAVQIYKTTTGGISGSYIIKGSLVTQEASISGAYMEVLNVSSWFSTDTNNWSFGNVFVYSVMAMLFLMFLGFVLAYGALMLTARFIAIIFYLIFSPFMFLGWILPQFQSYATKWWKGFIGYCFFAPVYIFMLYIGLFALQQIKVGFGEDATFGAAFGKGGEQTVDTMSIFLLFAIGTGFLIGATKVASVMSNGGAAIGMGAMDKLSSKFTTTLATRTGRGAAGAAGAFAYRNTGGLIAGGALAAMDRADRGLAAHEARNSHRSWLGRKAAGGFGLRSVAREVAGGTATRGAAEGARNYGAGGRGRKQVEDDMKAQNERTGKANKKAILKDTLKNGSADQKQKAWKQFSTTEVDEMAKDPKGRATLLANAEFLTDGHMKKLQDDHPELHNEVKTKQKDKVLERFSDPATVASVFENYNGTPKSDKEIAKLDRDILIDTRTVPYLSAKTLHHIFRDTDITASDRTTIKDNLTAVGAPVDPVELIKINTWFGSTEGSLF